jgi:hypothetical protein
MSLTYRYVRSGFEIPAECYSLIVWSGGQGMLVLRMQKEDVRDMLNTGSCGWLPRQRGFL